MKRRKHHNQPNFGRTAGKTTWVGLLVQTSAVQWAAKLVLKSAGQKVDLTVARWVAQMVGQKVAQLAEWRAAQWAVHSVHKLEPS